MMIYMIEYGDMHEASIIAACETEEIARQYIESYAKTIGYGNIGRNFYWDEDDYRCSDLHSFFSIRPSILIDKNNIEEFCELFNKRN